MTASMATVYTLGMMVNNMKAGGRMVNSTEKESTGKMDVTDVVSGKMVKESSGSMMSTDKVLVMVEQDKMETSNYLDKLPVNNDSINISILVK